MTYQEQQIERAETDTELLTLNRIYNAATVDSSGAPRPAYLVGFAAYTTAREGFGFDVVTATAIMEWVSARFRDGYKPDAGGPSRPRAGSPTPSARARNT